MDLGLINDSKSMYGHIVLQQDNPNECVPTILCQKLSHPTKEDVAVTKKHYEPIQLILPNDQKEG